MRSKAIVACIAFVPFLMAASGPVRLQPSSPWDVDYAENSCRLIRLFGEGQNETILFFESGAPGEMDLLAVGKPLSTSAEQVAARFLPLGKATFNGDLAATTTKRDPSILWPNVPLVPDDLIDKFKKEHEARQLQTRVRPPPLDLAEVASDRAKRQQFAAQTTELEIQTRHKQTVILETGSLGEPMRMFEKCSSDSLKDWGVNPDLEDKIVRPVWPRNITSWFSANDYPKDMVARGEESQVTIRVLVDATGRVTKCTALSHFTEAEFNEITCGIVARRASFAPAELADGTKVPSYYVNRVIFRIAR